MKQLFICVIVGAGLLGVAACETKEMAADPAAIVAQRQALMKDNGSNWAAINDFLEKGQGNSHDVIVAAESSMANADKIPGLFPDGTSADDLPGKSYAKPEIWSNWAQFETAAKNLETEAGKLAAAARSGDNTAIKAQFDAFSGACGGCHKPFRISKEG